MSGITAETHVLFNGLLEGSIPNALLIARHLWLCGLDVELLPTSWTTDHTQRRKFRDKGDMRVRNEDGHVGIREVKTTNTLIFTCRDDIKRPNVIVDTIAKFAAKPERPEFYYLVSGNGTHAAEICVATTRHLWTPDDTVTDDLSGNLQPCWRVPVSAIHIFKIRRE